MPEYPSQILAYTRLDDFQSNFSVPRAGPYLTHLTRWQIGGGRIRQVATHVLQTPLFVLDQATEAVRDQKWKTLQSLVPNHTVRASFKATIEALEDGTDFLTLISLGPSNTSTDSVFELQKYDEHGQRKHKFTLHRYFSHWVITRVH